ncbi:MAG TPA: hypothetical protein VKM55_24255 [Candidatus Lokiarchaeia archaeon]|nr:hypothetical protein [Candidatus Lokiarchaeia archaeon]
MTTFITWTSSITISIDFGLLNLPLTCQKCALEADDGINGKKKEKHPIRNREMPLEKMTDRGYIGVKISTLNGEEM